MLVAESSARSARFKIVLSCREQSASSNTYNCTHLRKSMALNQEQASRECHLVRMNAKGKTTHPTHGVLRGQTNEALNQHLRSQENRLRSY